MQASKISKPEDIQPLVETFPKHFNPPEYPSFSRVQHFDRFPSYQPPMSFYSTSAFDRAGSFVPERERLRGNFSSSINVSLSFIRKHKPKSILKTFININQKAPSEETVVRKGTDGRNGLRKQSRYNKTFEPSESSINLTRDKYIEMFYRSNHKSLPFSQINKLKARRNTPVPKSGVQMKENLEKPRKNDTRSSVDREQIHSILSSINHNQGNHNSSQNNSMLSLQGFRKIKSKWPSFFFSKYRRCNSCKIDDASHRKNRRKKKFRQSLSHLLPTVKSLFRLYHLGKVGKLIKSKKVKQKTRARKKYEKEIIQCKTCGCKAKKPSESSLSVGYVSIQKGMEEMRSKGKRKKLKLSKRLKKKAKLYSKTKNEKTKLNEGRDVDGEYSGSVSLDLTSSAIMKRLKKHKKTFGS